MPYALNRLAGGALLVASLFAPAVFAAEPMPESMQSILKGMHVENYSTLALLDEKGAPMDPDLFAKSLKSGKAFKMSKKMLPNAGPEVTMQLQDPAASTAALPPPKLKAGDAFPAFHLTRLDGQAVDNQALAGRYTLMSFYFATCAPCIKEVPELNALAERRKDINVLAVTYDSADETRQFIDQHHLNLPVLPNAISLANAVGIRSYPTLALLDPQGKLVGIVTGSLPANSGGIGAWLDKLAAPAR